MTIDYTMTCRNEQCADVGKSKILTIEKENAETTLFCCGECGEFTTDAAPTTPEDRIKIEGGAL